MYLILNIIVFAMIPEDGIYKINDVNAVYVCAMTTVSVYSYRNNLQLVSEIRLFRKGICM